MEKLIEKFERYGTAKSISQTAKVFIAVAGVVAVASMGVDLQIGMGG